VGRRSRQRSGADKAATPTAEYRDPEGDVLVLRAVLKPAARREYGDVLAGGLHREDAQQRALELLFERLAASWTISGLELTGQKELLGRYRMASATERDFVRQSLRTHAAEHFPDLELP
jgi:hypothetical protein